MSSSINPIFQKLNNPLPGWEGQKHLAPNFRAEEIKNMGKEIENARKSAVMILLYEKEGEIFIPFIRRVTYDGVHSGQISLPGGKAEKSDKDFQHTALRETSEEIGIPVERIKILRQISDLYIPPSNFLVKVFVGYLAEKPLFVADQKEVETIIEVPVTKLLKTDNIKSKIFYRSSDGKERSAPYFDVCGIEIWGATAMIISELIEIIR